MKAPILGLAVATVAFAGSSVYLWQQLNEERARAAQVEETARKLNARITELEKARIEFAQQRMPAGFMAGHFATNGSPPPPPTAGEDKPDGGPERPVWTTIRHEPPPAVKKMMQSQIRSSTRRLYADVGPKLGLSKDTASKLVDLLAEQQMARMDAVRTADSPEEVGRRSDKLAQDNEQAISDLIGPDKAMSLEEYQQSLPARLEVDNLARQLEGNDTALTAEQRQKLTDIFVAERARVPQPEYLDGGDEDEYARQMSAWRDDYDKRVASEASSVLNPEQLTTYNEIQQFQKEVRDHGPPLPPGFHRSRGDAPVNMMFTAGVPVGAVGVTSGGVITPVPPPKRP